MERLYQFHCLILKPFCRKRNDVKDGQRLFFAVLGMDSLMAIIRYCPTRGDGLYKERKKCHFKASPPSTDSNAMKKMRIMNIRRESEFTYGIYAGEKSVNEESVDAPVKNQVIIVHWQVGSTRTK